MESILTSLLNIGGVGVIAAALVWKVIPSMLATFSKEQQATRDAHDAQLKAEREAHGQHIEKLVGRLDRVEAAVRDLAGKRGEERRPFVRQDHCEARP